MRTVIAIFLVLAFSAATATQRDPKQRAEFVHTHPCPATGKPRGACPGWVVDHIKPLACGGADRPENMQWQTVADAKAKDRWERRRCEVKKWPAKNK